MHKVIALEEFLCVTLAKFECLCEGRTKEVCAKNMRVVEDVGMELETTVRGFGGKYQFLQQYEAL